MADRSLMTSRSGEPTGQPESLVGRIDPKGMGSKVRKESIKDLDKMKAKSQKQAQEEANMRGGGGVNRSSSGSNQGVVARDIMEATSLESLNYKPKTQETRNIYELLLNLVSSTLGDQENAIVLSATDLVIEYLKDDDLKDFDKKKEIETLLGTNNLESETFGQFVNLSKKLTDYDLDEEDGNGNGRKEGGGVGENGEIDDETGVAVMFENEDEEEEEDEVGFVERDEDDDDDEEERDQDDEEKEDGDQENGNQDSKDEALIIGNDSNNQRNQSRKNQSSSDGKLSVHEVDTFYLQRLISSHYSDENEASEKTSKAMEYLSAESSDIREIENNLMELFDYDKFDLVKILTQNREIIVWCTKLGNADENERVNIEVAMREKGVGWILKQLRRTGGGEVGGSNSTQINDGLIPMDIDEDAQKRAYRINAKATLAPGTTAQPRKGVDLESMKFSQGGHLNSNTKVKLPEGSFKRSKKGYEEIHIPAPIKKEIPLEDLVPISSLPHWAQSAFPGAKSLNSVQSKCYPIAFGTDEPMLLCAPTGAGKTNVAMLTILNELSKWRNESTGEFDLNAFKIVYVAPMKALVAEQTSNFRDRLSHYGIVVNELTGDSQLNKEQIAQTQIIVTTPEKWDVISRKSNDSSYTNLVRLIIVDEIHLLHDDRGPVLEAIISRTIRKMEQLSDPVRIVGLSATLPNYKDVATFLRVNPKKGLFFFESNYRPCPLKQEYVGITEKKAIKRFQVMNQVCYEKTLDQAGKNQVMIFTHSRKETAKTAKFLRDHAMEEDTLGRFLPQSSASREVLQTGESRYERKRVFGYSEDSTLSRDQSL